MDIFRYSLNLLKLISESKPIHARVYGALTNTALLFRALESAIATNVPNYANVVKTVFDRAEIIIMEYWRQRQINPWDYATVRSYFCSSVLGSIQEPDSLLRCVFMGYSVKVSDPSYILLLSRLVSHIYYCIFLTLDYCADLWLLQSLREANLVRTNLDKVLHNIAQKSPMERAEALWEVFVAISEFARHSSAPINVNRPNQAHDLSRLAASLISVALDPSNFANANVSQRKCSTYGY